MAGSRPQRGLLTDSSLHSRLSTCTEMAIPVIKSYSYQLNPDHRSFEVLNMSAFEVTLCIPFLRMYKVLDPGIRYVFCKCNFMQMPSLRIELTRRSREEHRVIDMTSNSLIGDCSYFLIEPKRAGSNRTINGPVVTLNGVPCYLDEPRFVHTWRSMLYVPNDLSLCAGMFRCTVAAYFSRYYDRL